MYMYVFCSMWYEKYKLLKKMTAFKSMSASTWKLRISDKNIQKNIVLGSNRLEPISGPTYTYVGPDLGSSLFAHFKKYTDKQVSRIE